MEDWNKKEIKKIFIKIFVFSFIVTASDPLLHQKQVFPQPTENTIRSLHVEKRFVLPTAGLAQGERPGTQQDVTTKKSSSHQKSS